MGLPRPAGGSGCPQLAARSALQAFSLRFKSLGSAACGGPALIPQPAAAKAACRTPMDQKSPVAFCNWTFFWP
ncbi:hypothetical protein SGRA_2745 [Saprospira grandis str. Lewin]|uniref:Uncharacterized protein n=1 Tax=Saprospira grandis (strain Lewin) TaxID=984262 RepID=H6L9J7_SAPGL|nr:hypothetical protein SGRA_2745 [Saprospira grandis str. Lewin]